MLAGPITLRSRGSNPAPAIIIMNAEIFIILVLTHFVSDWMMQPTAWGSTKIKNWKTRFLHSIQYSIIFLPVFYFLSISLYWGFYLFITHFIIDSYIPVTFWNKHIRNAINKRKIKKGEPPVFITIVEDQIIHILLLIPLA